MSGPVLVVENSVTDPVARLGDWLRGAAVNLQVVDGLRLPANLDGYAGLIVMGGPMGANDDDAAPWLPHVRALLREAVEREIPTLGVCLGGQLLAAATGGRVERNPDGPEIGAQLVAKRAAAATDPLFRSLPITPDVIQWHDDVITALPPGAIHLASSPFCDNQAFRFGRLAWGLQFHIETTPDMVRAWAAEHGAAAGGADLAAVVDRAIAVHDDLAEVWEPFARSFAEIVREPAAVPAPHGVRTTTAAPVTDPEAIRAALAGEAAAARLPLPRDRDR